MRNKESLLSQVTLGTGAELVANISIDILNTCDDTNSNVGGSPLSNELIHQLAQSSFQIKLNNDLKGQ